MTLRDKIMDKYWIEFVKSDYFLIALDKNPLDRVFWRWFRNNHLESQPPSKNLGDYL